MLKKLANILETNDSFMVWFEKTEKTDWLILVLVSRAHLCTTLNPFLWSTLLFYNSWIYQKTCGFLMLSGYLEKKYLLNRIKVFLEMFLGLLERVAYETRFTTGKFFTLSLLLHDIKSKKQQNILLLYNKNLNWHETEL